MVSKYLLLVVIFSGLVTWIPRMIASYRRAFFEVFACFHYLCLDPFKRSDWQGWESSSNQMVGLFSSLSNGLGSLSLPQSSGYGTFWSSLDCSLAPGLLVSHKKNLSPR